MNKAELLSILRSIERYALRISGSTDKRVNANATGIVNLARLATEMLASDGDKSPNNKNDDDDDTLSGVYHG